MATTIEIYIRGLAFFYYEEAAKLWKVIFLCEKVNTEHQLLFSIGSSTSKKPLFRAKKIEFTVTNEEPHASHRGSNFDIIFNIVKDAHKDNGVVFKQLASAHLNIIEMSIPAAQVFTKKLTNRKYLLAKKKGNVIHPPKELRKVADTVGVRIKLKDNGSLILKIDGNPEPLGFNFSQPGATYTLTFDNNCDAVPHIPPCGSPFDSLLYYELVEDAVEKDLQYIATRASIARKSKLLRFSPEGNCDPVVSDPPPGGGDL
jgi:hypothetical protein